MLDNVINHPLIAAAVIVWTGAASYGIGVVIGKWKFHRILRRTAKLRKER